MRFKKDLFSRALIWDNQSAKGQVIVILIPLLSLAAGLGIALAAREQIRRGALRWREPYLPGLLLFQLLVLLPLGIYLLAKYPAWTVLYLAEAEEVSTGHGFWMVVGSLVAAAVGYQLGHFLCSRRQDRLLVGTLVLSCAGVLLFCILTADRLGSLAEDGKWREAPGLLDSDLGTLFAFVVPVVLGGLIFLLALFSIEGRKVRRATVESSPSLGAGSSKPTAAYSSGEGSHERKMSPVFGSMDISGSRPEFPDTTPSLTKSPSASGSTKKSSGNAASKK